MGHRGGRTIGRASCQVLSPPKTNTKPAAQHALSISRCTRRHIIGKPPEAKKRHDLFSAHAPAASSVPSLALLPGQGLRSAFVGVLSSITPCSPAWPTVRSNSRPCPPANRTQEVRSWMDTQRWTFARSTRLHAPQGTTSMVTPDYYVRQCAKELNADIPALNFCITLVLDFPRRRLLRVGSLPGPAGDLVACPCGSAWQKFGSGNLGCRRRRRESGKKVW